MTAAAIEQADADDVLAVEGLLAANRLPLAGVRECLPNILVARAGERIVGCVALELYQAGVLLRSVAVDEAWRAQGLGEALVEEAFVIACGKGASAAYLLTTTAAKFFPRFGFQPIERSEVPEEIRQSVEFSHACPESAVAMRATLRGHVW